MLNGLKTADFGYVGENGVTEVCFDFSRWRAEFGDGDVRMLLILPGGTSPVEVQTEIRGGVVVHTLTAEELAVPGKCRVQVVYAANGHRAKSAIWDAYIQDSLEVMENESDDES